MRYGIHTRLRRGIRISLFATLRCPLQCVYCSLRAGGDYPLKPREKSNELTLDEWKLMLIELFKFVNIREIYVTGGEPTLREDISALINFILDQGKCVTMHSNLWTDNAIGIKQTDRFRIHATFHRDDIQIRFDKYYKMYSAKYRVDVDEIDKQRLPYIRRVKPFEKQGPELGSHTPRFAIAPDGRMYVQMYKLFGDYYGTDKPEK